MHKFQCPEFSTSMTNMTVLGFGISMFERCSSCGNLGPDGVEEGPVVYREHWNIHACTVM